MQPTTSEWRPQRSRSVANETPPHAPISQTLHVPTSLTPRLPEDTFCAPPASNHSPASMSADGHRPETAALVFARSFPQKAMPPALHHLLSVLSPIVHKHGQQHAAQLRRLPRRVDMSRRGQRAPAGSADARRGAPHPAVRHALRRELSRFGVLLKTRFNYRYHSF
jgi:hypothetical protein